MAAPIVDLCETNTPIRATQDAAAYAVLCEDDGHEYRVVWPEELIERIAQRVVEKLEKR